MRICLCRLGLSLRLSSRTKYPLSSEVLVLVGEPGSGKTTQLPQILLDAGYHVQMGQVRAICCGSAFFSRAC